MQRAHYPDHGEISGLIDTKPYTYSITHIPTGRIYYGARYAKGCTPTDLWVSYFTSSKVVHQLILSDGIESFKIKIRRTFSTSQRAIEWEGRFLRKINARKNTRFLNKHNNDGLIGLAGDMNPMRDPEVVKKWKNSAKINNKKTGRSHSDTHKLAISKSLKGRVRTDDERAAISKGLKGYKHTQEYKDMCRIRQTGKIPTIEANSKRRDSILGRKKYELNGQRKLFKPGTEPIGWKPVKNKEIK